MLEAQPHTVADLMTPVVIAAHPNDTISGILSKMEELRFRHLPVIDDDEKLVGVVTQKDLLHASSSFLSDRAGDRDALIGQTPVSQIMQDTVISVKGPDQLAEAARLMYETKVGCLPVVNEDDKLVGILTESDFIRLALWYMAKTD